MLIGSLSGQCYSCRQHEAADVSDTQADLREYYETEAKLRRRGPLRGRRVELRDEFAQLLSHEGRASVLDLGAGPGGDGQGFQSAGLRFVGVDLAYGNARLALEANLEVVQGSVTSLPVRTASFDAGWSLSTFMHLDEQHLRVAVAEMVRAVRPGAPVVVGLWGNESEATVVSDKEIPGSQRPFYLRSFDRNRQLLTENAELEQSQRWEAASGEWDYHVFRLRTRP